MATFKIPAKPTLQAGYDSQAGSTSVWRVRIFEGRTAQIALVDGAGLTLSSNNPGVVPNDPVVFKELASSGSTRLFEIYGLAAESGSRAGFAMIEARRAGSGVVAYFQVQVSSISSRRAFFELDQPQMALNSSDTPVPYDMMYNAKIGYGTSASDVIAKVAANAKIRHLVFSCHGTSDPSRGGPKIEIGSGFTPSNIDLFTKLYPHVINVIWFGSCSIAGSQQGRDFCIAIAKAAGVYVVAPGIPVPYQKNVGKNRVEVFTRSLPHYIDREGNGMPQAKFLLLQAKLGFKLISVST